MAYTYMFFRPAYLPLTSEALSAATVLPLLQHDEIRTGLQQHLPGLVWDSALVGRAESQDRWIEVSLGDGGESAGLMLRCSQRADYTDVIQQLCDRTGWIAFDQTPLCFQPHHAPIPA